MNRRIELASILALLVALSGCDGDATTDDGGMTGTDSGPVTGVDSGPVTGVDAGPPMTDAGPRVDPDPTCENLCTTALANCSGNAAAYANMSECMTWCGTVGAWETGTVGDNDGNTIACRVHAANMAAPNCAAAGYTGGGVCGNYCENYCGTIANTCEGSDEVYASDAACMTACADIDKDGVPGTVSGDSVQCRIYHAGIPADTMPAVHCNHAGPTGLNEADDAPICALNAMGYHFRLDAPDTYTRIDRLGMPAVSTVLATNKAAYNNGDPSDDAALTFAGELIANLNGLHDALDDDLADISGITACSMDPSDSGDPNSLPVCLAQEVAAGVSVVALVVPDTVTLDLGAAAGFPNGRLLTDPVIDVTLSVILLDLTVNTPTTLVGTNPTENDVAFRSEFPYLAAAQ